jgi:hypothetical protein
MNVAAAGVDTWCLNWRLEDGRGSAWRAADAMATVKTKTGSMLPGDAVQGHRVIWESGHNLLRAEGHPSGDKAQLATVAELEAAKDRVMDELHALGLEVPRQTGRFLNSPHQCLGVSRLDPTVNLATDSAAHGLSLLEGVAAVEPERFRDSVSWRHGPDQALSSVSWRGKRGVLARVYDKGLESKTAPRGELLRFEGQLRWPGDARRWVEELTAEYVGGKFRDRFVPLWRASEGVKIVTMQSAVTELVQRVNRGDLRITEAEQALGHLVFSKAGVQYRSRQTRYRRRELVRSLGLVLGDGKLQAEQQVDLHEVLDAVVSSDAWERQG